MRDKKVYTSTIHVASFTNTNSAESDDEHHTTGEKDDQNGKPNSSVTLK